jgi:hypothetical protein
MSESQGVNVTGILFHRSGILKKKLRQKMQNDDKPSSKSMGTD